MTWLAWRLHRTPLILLASTVAVCAAALFYLRFDMQGFIIENGLSGCVNDLASGVCSNESFNTTFSGPLDMALSVMIGVPILIGMFVGAPLFAREFEHRTHLLALTQSVSRGRWLTSKIAVATIPAVAGLALLTLAYTSVTRTLGSLLGGDDSRFTQSLYEAQGLMPVAYGLFALLCGFAFGLMLRNTLGAIAATLALFGIVRVALDAVRPHLLTATTVHGRLGAFPKAPSGSWVLDSGWVDQAGNKIASPSLATCPNGTDEIACLKQSGLTGTFQTYHSPDTYVTFQLIEAGILIALAAALLAAGIWWLRTRQR